MPLVTAGLIMGGVSAGLSIIGGKQQAAINAAVAQNQQAWANAQANWSNLQMMFGTVQKNMDIAGLEPPPCGRTELLHQQLTITEQWLRRA